MLSQSAAVAGVRISSSPVNRKSATLSANPLMIMTQAQTYHHMSLSAIVVPFSTKPIDWPTVRPIRPNFEI